MTTTYLQYLAKTFPTIEEAKEWSTWRLGGGPLTEVEYQNYVELTGKDLADSMLISKAKTTFGYYLEMWGRYLVGLLPSHYRSYVSNEERYNEEYDYEYGRVQKIDYEVEEDE